MCLIKPIHNSIAFETHKNVHDYIDFGWYNKIRKLISFTLHYIKSKYYFWSLTWNIYPGDFESFQSWVMQSFNNKKKNVAFGISWAKTEVPKEEKE